jgi:hypothetical protein
MEIGCNSTSVPPSLVAKLERKGLITVKRYQRFREVTIIATGKTTARSPHQHVDHPHVPRGMRKVEGTPIMTDGRTYSIKTRNG